MIGLQLHAKIKNVSLGYFRSHTLEYAYAKIHPKNLPLPNFINNVYQVILVLLSFFYLIRKRFSLSKVEIAFASLLVYHTFTSLYSPVFSRLYLPYMIFLFYFAAIEVAYKLRGRFKSLDIE